MDWIKAQYKEPFWFYVFFAALLALFAPWMHGPFILDWIGTVLGAYIGLTIIVIARIVWATVTKKKPPKE